MAVLDRDGSALRIISPQGRLDVATNQPATALQPGPWQVRDDQFVPPRSGNLVWNDDTGLYPEVLRCPDNNSLLAPLGSVVLAIDPAGAKLVGKPR